MPSQSSQRPARSRWISSFRLALAMTGRWRAEDVHSILAAGAGVPWPRAAGNALVIELPRVAVRPLSDYKVGGTP